MPQLVIEHLENLSYWVWLEYMHLSRAWRGKVLFTNVRKREEREKLRRLGDVSDKSIVALADKFDKVIVLDPLAEKELSPDDISEDSALVIGGICGDFELTGRTFESITSKLSDKENVDVRNLGKKQLTTDTAAIVALLIANGKELGELEFTDAVEIELFPGVRVELPYGYLVLDGRPLLTPGLVQIFEAEYFGIENFPDTEILVVGAIVVREGKIMLLHRREEPLIWEFPSGKVEYGESLIQAVERELREETGLKLVRIIDYAGDFYYASRGGKARQFNFLVEAEGNVRLSEEHDEFRWVSYEELLKLRKGEDRGFLKELGEKLRKFSLISG